MRLSCISSNVAIGNPRSVAKQRGLTLIELVVVLAVLVALVGLVLAFFPDILRRASSSTSSSSAQDIARTLQVKYTSSLTYGDGYDNFAPSAGTLSTALASTNGITADVVTDAADVAALNSAGLTTVYNFTGTNTFTLTRSALALAASTPVARVDTNSAAGLNLVISMLGARTNQMTNQTFYLFGLGKVCSAVGPGSTMQEAPIRTGENAFENPANKYGHYGVVFVTEPAGSGRKAYLLGAVAMAFDGLRSASDSLQQYYQ